MTEFEPHMISPTMTFSHKGCFFEWLMMHLSNAEYAGATSFNHLQPLQLAQVYLILYLAIPRTNSCDLILTVRHTEHQLEVSNNHMHKP